MKKIFYLLAFVAVGFTSCDPLSKTYQQIDATPATIAFTLSTTYTTSALATTGIIATLNASYINLPDGEKANVTYVAPAATTSTFVPVATITSISYIMVTADYTFPGNTFPDLTASGVLNFLAYKYPTPLTNQEVLLTYNYYESGYTASSGTITTDAFVYAGGGWVKCYLVTPTEYATVGRGLTNTFDSADITNIPGYLASFLKNDASVNLTAKAGDVKYVSYKYATTSQYVLPMYYNGTTWTNTPTLAFVKTNGTWILDPTVYYKLTTADTKIIGASTATWGTAAERTNLTSYGDFSGWAVADVASGIEACLLVDFPSPKVNVDYKVTYLNYTGGADVPTVLTFRFIGGVWVYMP